MVSHHIYLLSILVILFMIFAGYDGVRHCLHCDSPQPGSKSGYIKHIAHNHENVIEEMAAQTIYGDLEEEERKKIEPNNELHEEDLD